MDNVQPSEEDKNGSQKPGIIPFVTEVARYFMDFLETDFHKVRIPKRHIQSHNSKNLQISIDIGKYKKYNALVWKVIRSGFKDDALNELKRGAYTNQIQKSLLELIEEQIETIDVAEINALIKMFEDEINLALLKFPNDTPAAITATMDGITRVIREIFVNSFILKINEPIDKIRSSIVDSVYQIESDLTDILTIPFEDVISTIINQRSLGKSVDTSQLLKQVFDLQDTKNKLVSFFKSFAVGDLFYEVTELVNNKNLLEKQEFYLYFCDITYDKHTYPLFYILELPLLNRTTYFPFATLKN